VNMEQDECLACEMAAVLRSRSGEIRRELRVMNPITNPNYDGLFQVLIGVDHDRRLALDHQHQTDKADA
jgi:hypothetical protein